MKRLIKRPPESAWCATVLYVALMTLDEARERLNPVATDLLVNPQLQAVRQWNSVVGSDPAAAATITPTTRAGLIHDYTVRAVRGALAGRSEAREIEAFDFFAVAVGTDFVVRYKYVARGLPSNNPTVAQQLLSLQQYNEEMMEDLLLDGIPKPPTFVTCGYTLDADGQVGVVSVQCDVDKTTLWRHVLWGESGEGLGGFETLPITPDLSPSPAVVRSTRKRSSASDADAE
jgi:hypothetical protein